MLNKRYLMDIIAFKKKKLMQSCHPYSESSQILLQLEVDALVQVKCMHWHEYSYLVWEDIDYLSF